MRDGLPLVIVGGGLAGGLAALALARLRPETPLLLIEGAPAFGGNHIWSFFDPDVAPAHRWLVEPLIGARWPAYDVAFPAHRRTLETGYNSIRSEALDAALKDQLAPHQYRLGARIAHVADDAVELASGERIAARGVIDARGPGGADALDLGWQKFVGREYAFAAPHGLDRPVIMDATVDQTDGYRFVYCLPFSATEMLVEDTYYSTDRALDQEIIGHRIDAYVRARGWPDAQLVREETGVLPVAMGGDFDAFWPDTPGAPARLGLAGAFFHPTTGYSLPDAVRMAMAISAASDLSGPALARLTRSAAERLWRRRRFYRMLDTMLFRAAAPAERYRVLQRFYRLDPVLIGRFYAGEANLMDKMRILTGRPPVPIGRAVKALLGRRGARG